MGRQIEWYLVELERRLADSMPKDLVEQMLREAGEHLKESARDLEKEQTIEEDAEKEAIHRFGSPAEAARHLIEAALPKGKQPLPKWPVIWAIVASAWGTLWISTGWYTGLLLCLFGAPILGLGVLASSLFSRRARPWAIACVGGVATLTLTFVASTLWTNLYLSGGQGLAPLWQVSSMRSDQVQLLSQLQSDRPKLHDGILAFRTGGGLSSFHDQDGWLMPQEPYLGWRFEMPLNDVRTLRVPAAAVEYVHTAKLEDARAAWRSVGVPALSELDFAIERANDEIRAIDTAGQVPWSRRIGAQVRDIVPVGIGWTAVLLLANFLGVWLGELVRWLTSRTWRVARD